MKKTSNPNQGHTVYLDHTTSLGDGVFWVKFRFDDNFAFKFEPGQYVWLVLSKLRFPDPRGERRALTIISSNSDKNHIEFLVRDSESGFKKTLKSLKVGEEAKIIGPFGSSFVIPKDNINNIHFISGGVAIAPFLGVARSYGQKMPYRLRIAHFSSSISRKLDVVGTFIPQAKEWGVEISEQIGEFTESSLSREIDYQQEQFYVTGPQGFVNAVGAFLKTRGVPDHHCHYEENYPEPVNNLSVDQMRAEGKSLMIRAVHASNNHLIITDANGKVIFANKAAEKMTGYTLPEMLGSTPRLWGGAMDGKFYQDFWRRKHDKEGFDGELRNRRKNGEIYTVSTHISPILSEDGAVIGYIGSEEDISRLLDQNKQLEDSKIAMLNVLEDLEVEKKNIQFVSSRFALAKRAAKIGIWEWDVAKNILTWDDQMYALYGIKKADFSGAYDAWQKGLFPEDRLKGDEAVASALKGEQDFNLQFRVVWPDNSIRFIQAHAVVERDSEGKPLKMVGVNWDITKEKQIDKAKTEFVSLASHQLRTPLSTINWYAEMLLAGDAGDLADDQKKYVEEIYTGNQLMVDLVNSLLNVSRIDLGTFSVEPEPTNIVELAQVVIKEAEPDIFKKKMDVREEYADNLPIMNVDSKLMRIVFQNLLSNSIKYTPEKGIVTIAISADDHDLKISIADNGYGIQKDQQDKIFTKLFRADNIKQKDAIGTGLGLYLVKSIIEHSDGKIWFESEENKGTTFYVTLPISGMRAKAGSKSLSN